MICKLQTNKRSEKGKKTKKKRTSLALSDQTVGQCKPLTTSQCLWAGLSQEKKQKALRGTTETTKLTFQARITTETAAATARTKPNFSMDSVQIVV